MTRNNEIIDVLNEYLEYLFLERNLTKETLTNYKNDLLLFVDYTNTDRISFLTKTEIIEFVKEQSRLGKNPKTICRYISSIKGFYLYLARAKRIQITDLRVESPKIKKSIPPYITYEEIEKFLEQPYRANNFNEVREKAMIELMYATGLRVSELLSLKLEEVNFVNQVIRVIGKGNKERVIHIGEYALNYLLEYMSFRNNKFRQLSNTTIFVSNQGLSLSRQYFFKIVKERAKKCGIAGSFSPHSLRHAFATHLLEGGASLLVVQELLGHSNIETTEIYLSSSTNRIRSVYDRVMKR